jgi:hypothetical protein
MSMLPFSGTFLTKAQITPSSTQVGRVVAR